MTSMMTSQILTFLVLSKSQKSTYLENEIFFLEIKKINSLYNKGHGMSKTSFLADVTFKRIVKRAELNKCDIRLVSRIL